MCPPAIVPEAWRLPATSSRYCAPGVAVPIPTLAEGFVRLTLAPASVQPEAATDGLLKVTFFDAGSNETVVAPAPSNRSSSLFDPAENCAAPAAFATVLKMFCAEPRSLLVSVTAPVAPPPERPPPAVTPVNVPPAAVACTVPSGKTKPPAEERTCPATSSLKAGAAAPTPTLPVL